IHRPPLSQPCLRPRWWNGSSPLAWATTLIVIAIGSALTGILLCGLGLARAGRAIRFVPYPVIGGFLGATGWLVVSGAVLVVTDLQLDKRTFWRKANIMCGVRDVR
ncbi:MAG: SulP family inorganic anion transporter, partial [Pseudolabrys sp.]